MRGCNQFPGSWQYSERAGLVMGAAGWRGVRFGHGGTGIFRRVVVLDGATGDTNHDDRWVLWMAI